MNPYLKLIRPSVCLLSIFGLIVGLLLVGIPFELWILPVLGIFLFSASGNTINDFFDFEIDKINKPERPLPSGKISKKITIGFYLSLALVGLVISFFVSLNFFILALLNSILIFMYSRKFKKTLLGNPVDSWLACSVFLAPVLISGGLTELLTSTTTILAIIAFFGNYGREILKDVEDIKGDKIIRARTLPIVFGEFKATILGKILMIVGSVFLFLPFFFKGFGLIYLVLAILCFFICLSILTVRDVKVAQKLIKVVMFLVIFSFLTSLFF